MVKEWSDKAGYEILPLTDNQALVVADGNIKMVK